MTTRWSSPWTRSSPTSPCTTTTWPRCSFRQIERKIPCMFLIFHLWERLEGAVWAGSHRPVHLPCRCWTRRSTASWGASPPQVASPWMTSSRPALTTLVRTSTTNQELAVNSQRSLQRKKSCNCSTFYTFIQNNVYWSAIYHPPHSSPQTSVLFYILSRSKFHQFF